MAVQDETIVLWLTFMHDVPPDKVMRVPLHLTVTWLTRADGISLIPSNRVLGSRHEMKDAFNLASASKRALAILPFVPNSNEGGKERVQSFD